MFNTVYVLIFSVFLKGNVYPFPDPALIETNVVSISEVSNQHNGIVGARVLKVMAIDKTVVACLSEFHENSQVVTQMSRPADGQTNAEGTLKL